MDNPYPFVYLISGTLPISALIHLRQLSLLIQLNQLGPSHSSYIHAVLTLQSTSHPKWSWWTKMALTCDKYDIPSPLLILSSKLTKNELKSQFKKKVSAFWFKHYISMCPSYSSLKFSSTSKLLPIRPHPFILHSGTFEYLNHKSSIMLKLL